MHSATRYHIRSFCFLRFFLVRKFLYFILQNARMTLFLSYILWEIIILIIFLSAMLSYLWTWYLVITTIVIGRWICLTLHILILINIRIIYACILRGWNVMTLVNFSFVFIILIWGLIYMTLTDNIELHWIRVLIS